jgi:hypothetical protein
MNLKRVAGFLIVLLCCFFNAACFSIEKEIFLNADGSGELVLHVSMPDLPEDATKGSTGTDKNPAAEIEKFKRDIMTKLPPSIKLKEAKQVKHNGMISFYAVLEFKELKETETILSSFGENGLNEFANGQSEWSVQLDKQADKMNYAEKFFINVDQSKKSASSAVKGSAPTRGGATANKKPPQKNTASKANTTIPGDSKEFDEKMQILALSLVKMRFVLHTPSPIKESNADIVMKDRIAVWNCSLLNFAKDKKPIEMRATF